MKIIDLFRMSLQNLWKRKVRTILTVLGVVIGVASIVVMVSLGIGLKASMMESMKNYASLTAVQVEPPYEREGQAEKDKIRLDDETIELFKTIPHVVSVDPEITVSTIAKSGIYEAYFEITGTTMDSLKAKNINVAEGGRLPDPNTSGLELFMGNQILPRFYIASSGKGYWETGVMPKVNLMEDPIFYIFDTENYNNSSNSNNGSVNAGDSTATTKPRKAKKHQFPVCGLVAGTQDDYYPTSWSVYADIDKLIPELQKEFKGRVIPGQPQTKKGKPYKKIFYNRLIVNVDDMANVAEVTKTISDMSYVANNDAEWINQEMDSMNMIQAVLGGIGAVALLVAAIGITNTMMMSIYERTREIGIMKVLGCDMHDIARLFLMEAGFIGFFGGLFGLAISYGMSFLMNKAVAGSDMGMEYISVIPFWLAIASMLFAIMVGMLAGFFPAKRAMKLSPLAAIRSE